MYKKLVVTLLMLCVVASFPLFAADDKPTSISLPKGYTRIVVPLDIPTALIDQGAIEMYATFHGWTKDSGVRAVDFCINRIRQMVKDEYAEIMRKTAEEQARTQAQAQYTALFGGE